MAVKVQGPVSRHLFDGKAGIYYKGQQAVLLARNGDVIIGDDLPDVPTIISTIADREYTVGGSAVTIDLATKFAGATSYTVSPTPAGVSLAGAILTINPTTALAQTAISVRGVNAGGQSDPLTFALTVRVPAPTLTIPLPDVSRTVGAANLVVDLREHFAGATSYTASPTAQGATVSGYNLTISAASARDTTITITATNSTGSVADTFALVVTASDVAPTVTTAPTITGDTSPTGTLTLTPGTASGTPTPTRVIAWLYNGSALSGETGLTLDKAGRIGAFQGRVTWSNSAGNAVGTSNTITTVAEDPELSVDIVDGFAVVSGDGVVTWTITEPTEYAGTHTADRSAELSGPLNIGYTENTAPQYVVPPVVRRHAGPGSSDNHYPGTEYRRTIGLAQVKSGTGAVVTGEWFEGGAATGYTGLAYTRSGVGDVEYRERTEVAGQPARTAVSNAITGEAVVGTETLFVGVPDGTGITAFPDPTGRAWGIGVGGSNGLKFAIYSPYIRKIHNSNSPLPAFTNDVLTNDQEAWVRIRFPAVFAAAADYKHYLMGPAVRILGGGTSAQGRNYYVAPITATSQFFWSMRRAEASTGPTSLLWQSPEIPLSSLQGRDVKLGVRAVGGDISILVDDEVLQTVNDPTPHVGGGGGIIGFSGTATENLTIDQGLFAFDCRSV